MEVESILERLRAFRPRELTRVSAQQFYKELVMAVSELCGTTMNSLYLVEPGGHYITLQAAIGLPEQWLKVTERIPVASTSEAGVCGQAVALKEIVVVTD